MSDNYETELTAEELAEIEEQAKKEAEEAFVEDDFDDDIFGEEDGVYVDSDGEIDDADLGESTGNEQASSHSEEEFTESDDAESFDEANEEESGEETDTIRIDANSTFYNEIGEITIMDSDISEDTFSLEYLDISDIVVTPRIRKSSQVEWLTKSIKATGLLEPIMVAPTEAEGVYVLLHGLHRLYGCAKAGIKKVPCIVNNKINTTELRVVEAMYNKCKRYTMGEIIDYIKYLENEKNIKDSNMIEYLTQLNDGDYSKLKDILNDNDEEIVPKLLDGVLTIPEAFAKLEKRRKKETPEERQARQAQKVYESNDQTVQNSIRDSGETADSPVDALTDDEVKEIMLGVKDLDGGLEDKSLEEMVEESDQIEGFQPHKQKVGERERIDPAIKKATLARDKFTCRCCNMGGEAFVSVLDYHHVIPVYAGGDDSVDNGISLCITCHNLVHQHGYGDLHLPAAKTEEELEAMSERDRILYEEERLRYKRIVKLGNYCRMGLAKKGIKKEQAKKDNPAYRVGRRMPGSEQSYEM